MTMKLTDVGAVTALVLLTACGPGGCGDEQKSEQEQQRVRVYASVLECEADRDETGARRHTDEDCTKAFDQAQDAHKTAPQFSERTACEEKYDHCETRREGDHDVFMPFLEGFLVGHLLSGGSSTVVTQPVYVDRNGAAYAGSSRLGSYRRCDPGDSSCGSSRGGFGYVYGGAGGRSTGTGVWSSGSYATQTATAPSPAPALSRGGLGGSASSVSMPSASDPGGAMAPAASTGSSVARGGFGATAATAASAGE